MPINPLHQIECTAARDLYLSKSTPTDDRANWLFALREARKRIGQAIRASNYLFNVEDAVKVSGRHCLVFRHIVAPPKSQDQFKLLCPEYSKTSEKNGTSVIAADAAAIAAIISQRRDPSIGKWVDLGRKPHRREIEEVFNRLAPLIASQQVATAKRNRLAFEQEIAVVNLLVADGWIREPSRLIDTRAHIPTKHFMHKTRFATATTAHQEVDIACGLKNTYILAMECKVTNDETNSVKRINDVLKKHDAWKKHWGNFVETAALLEGVIAAKDVQRLEDAGVHIFWSHDLSFFKKWLASRI